jgi:hypothetical protein
MLHVSLDCPFTFIFRFSKIQQNVMIIKYDVRLLNLILIEL